MAQSADYFTVENNAMSIYDVPQGKKKIGPKIETYCTPEVII